MNTERNAMPNYVSIDYFFQTLLNGSKLNSGVIFFFKLGQKHSRMTRDSGIDQYRLIVPSAS